MKTQTELLILGLKARQLEIKDQFFKIASEITSVLEDGSIKQLSDLNKEYRAYENQLRALDPDYNKIPF